MQPNPQTITWTSHKPADDREFILLTATQFRGVWDYSFFTVRKIQSDEGWYFGLVSEDGGEWGIYEDLTADFYCVVEMI